MRVKLFPYLQGYYCLVVGLLLNTCRDKEPDPCKDLKPFEANFTIEEAIEDTTFVSDTCLVNRFVVFRAKAGYDSYEWTVGSDSRTFKDSVFALYFENPASGIQVRLIAKKKPNTACFPQDNGIDTLTKSLTIVKPEQVVIPGVYRGALVSNPADVFEVRIEQHPLYPSHYDIYNINKGCNQGWQVEERLGYSGIYFDNSVFQNNCNFYYGYAALLPNRKDIEVRFVRRGENIPGQPSVHIHEKFIGTRVP
jgi:hypothetical protein